MHQLARAVSALNVGLILFFGMFPLAMTRCPRRMDYGMTMTEEGDYTSTWKVKLYKTVSSTPVNNECDMVSARRRPQ
ncbi:hypothetical protein VD0002_g3323 [Verticillium dahliae]|uniref:Uncharacterized protein n=1 Tax=Verticillium dahliae TaxID=27337 RepID=A0AA45APV1_VERDA|nr:hypothetical protein EV126DRAFT_432184 [Verticillium dahliae]PNH34705.1 hypothetical protein BJF96_g2271 [Verticillium dahliae]PNH65845.1 hypothetical protein VD0002_g3323 [Verticillium dahliae]